MFMIHFRKGVTVFGFVRFAPPYFSACVVTDRLTQSVERQAEKTFTTVLFKKRIDNSQKVFAISNARENFLSSFRFCIDDNHSLNALQQLILKIFIKEIRTIDVVYFSFPNAYKTQALFTH